MTDKREILNEAEVDFLLSAAGDDAEAAPTAGAEGQTVTMHGDLEQINLADIFQTLAMSKMEGVLLLRNPLEERHVHCRDGYVRIMISNRATSRRLGQRVIQAGLVQPEQLRTALLEQRKDRKPLGQVLVTAGLVSQEQIDELLGVQVSEDLFALFTWRHGAFEFWKGPVTDATQRAAFDLCPEFEVNSLLLEVARRSDEWQSILEAIGNVDEVPQRIGDLSTIEKPTELHEAVFRSIDGELTYRDLTEQTTAGLFEMARAARDLARSGAIQNVDDMGLAALATQAAEAGRGKKALLLLQTLRDRPGQRSMEVLDSMATALQHAGEKRLAGNLLLEAAQNQEDPATAIALARRARDLAPFDAATLSYLRTVLLAHTQPDDQELEKVTLQLLDALLEADEPNSVLELTQSARATSTASAAVLVREARAHQKARDPQAAVATWLEVAALHDAAGDRAHAIEAYEAVWRLDRSRKDIAKLVRQRKRTRLGRIVRAAATAAATVMVGGAGFVYWQESSFATAVQQASHELDALLANGERANARERWDHWLSTIGPCEAVEDMRTRIAFAEASEQGRQQKLFRGRVNTDLARAAEALAKGELAAALGLYQTLHAEPAVRAEVAEIVTTRLDACLTGLEALTKGLAHRLPPAPESVFDRRDLQATLDELNAALPGHQIQLFDGLVAAVANSGLPDFLDAKLTQRARKLVAEGEPVLARSKSRLAAYTEALRHNDTQRRLDPMFKAAVEKSAAHDFAGALALFQQLANQPLGDDTLHKHFRQQVEKHAAIVRLLEEQRAATNAGDHRLALEHLRTLRTSFPDLPFEQLVQLPLTIDSLPAGAQVLIDGSPAGVTPLQLVRKPLDTLSIEVRLDGFLPNSAIIRNETEGSFRSLLALAATSRWQHDSMIEVPPAQLPSGRTFVVDRAGAVSSIDPKTGARSWNWRSGDLSGLLTTPLLHGNTLLVASLDGELRSIDQTNGKPVWALSGLPTEATPLLVRDHLIVATTDKQLVSVDLDDRTRTAVALPEPVHPNGLCAYRDLVITCGENGRVRAYQLPQLQRTWERDLDFGGACVLLGNVLVQGGERGSLIALRADDGEVLWRHQASSDLLGAPAKIGTDLLITTAEEIVRLETTKGGKVITIPCGEVPWAGAAIGIGARVVAPTRDGPMLVFDATTGRVLYRLEADRQTRPLVAGTTLFLVSKEHVVQSFQPLR